MTKTSSLYRLYLILNKLKKENVCPSKEELKDFLEGHDFKTSSRTIDRDLAEIRIVFGIEVKWDAGRRGYYIDKEESWDYEGMLRLLEVCVLGDLLMDTIGEGKDALKYVLFDSSSDLKGIELMGPILQAIKLHQRIQFDYSKFHEETSETHELEPYALKEYQGRGDVVGTVKGAKKMYVVGLDRIDKLGIVTQTFVPKKTVDPNLEFDEIIGVTRLNEEVEDVVLSFTPLQGNYVKTFPWHRSQKVLVDNENELRIRIRVIPNFELTQRILMQGKSVEVIGPDWLRVEIKENLQNTIEKYSTA